MLRGCSRGHRLRRSSPSLAQVMHTMKIRDLMTASVKSCGPRDSLNLAAQLMWEHDCGALPIVDDVGQVIGMITDRDVCMGAYTRGLPLVDIKVASCASHGIVTIREDESVDAAQALMQRHRIRRVPVVDPTGRPVGIVSMTDLARHARCAGLRGVHGLTPEEVVDTLAVVCAPARGAIDG
jgi:CBS-domain-containing membrane protein